MLKKKKKKKKKKKIQQQLKTGIIEEVPGQDLTNKAASQSYLLPLLAVFRKDREATKVRAVYDGSAKTSEQEIPLNKISFNFCGWTTLAQKIQRLCTSNSHDAYLVYAPHRLSYEKLSYIILNCTSKAM